MLKPCFAGHALHHFAVMQTATFTIYVFLGLFIYFFLFPVSINIKWKIAKNFIFEAFNKMTAHFPLNENYFRRIHSKPNCDSESNRK